MIHKTVRKKGLIS